MTGGMGVCLSWGGGAGVEAAWEGSLHHECHQQSPERNLHHHKGGEPRIALEEAGGANGASVEECDLDETEDQGERTKLGGRASQAVNKGRGRRESEPSCAQEGCYEERVGRAPAVKGGRAVFLEGPGAGHRRATRVAIGVKGGGLRAPPANCVAIWALPDSCEPRKQAGGRDGGGAEDGRLTGSGCPPRRQLHEHHPDEEQPEREPAPLRDLALEQQHCEECRGEQLELVGDLAGGSVEVGGGHVQQVVLHQVQQCRHAHQQRVLPVEHQARPDNPRRPAQPLLHGQDGEGRDHLDQFSQYDSRRRQVPRLARHPRVPHRQHLARVLHRQCAQHRLPDRRLVEQPRLTAGRLGAQRQQRSARVGRLSKHRTGSQREHQHQLHRMAAPRDVGQRGDWRRDTVGRTFSDAFLFLKIYSLLLEQGVLEAIPPP
eukprot:scaffold9696_cov112-Isochrysis_galbana.AAC.2